MTSWAWIAALPIVAWAGLCAYGAGWWDRPDGGWFDEDAP